MFLSLAAATDCDFERGSCSNGDDLEPDDEIPKKRVRTIFTSAQLDLLEREFQRQQYLVGTERSWNSQLFLSRPSSGGAIPGRARANALAEIPPLGCRPALAVKSSNNKIIYHDILTALAAATNDLSMPIALPHRFPAMSNGLAPPLISRSKQCRPIPRATRGQIDLYS